MEDIGSRSEDLPPGETYGLVGITAYVGKVENSYNVRRALPMALSMDRFEKWELLMKNEKQVCVAGSGPDISEKSKDVSWVFEGLETTKGCDSYFG